MAVLFKYPLGWVSLCKVLIGKDTFNTNAPSPPPSSITDLSLLLKSPHVTVLRYKQTTHRPKHTPIGRNSDFVHLDYPALELTQGVLLQQGSSKGVWIR